MAESASVPVPPCRGCGACCAAFRVSFYWGEADARGLPAALTEQVDAFRCCLRGTWAGAPRCVALAGVVGQAVRCTVYEARPDPCREVQPGDLKCARARARHGLPPLDGAQVAAPAAPQGPGGGGPCR